jgi:hypothetical protein
MNATDDSKGFVTAADGTEFSIQSEQVRGEPRSYWIVRRDVDASSFVDDGVYGETDDARTAHRRLQKRLAEWEGDADVMSSMERAANDANRRIATCHERVACPKCNAPVGERCRRMPRGYHGMGPSGAILKTAHEERWTQETPAR